MIKENDRKLIQQVVAGVVERSRERRQRRWVYRQYYRLCDGIRTGKVSTFQMAIDYLTAKHVLFQQESVFGYRQISVDRYPVLVFTEKGSFAGRSAKPKVLKAVLSHQLQLRDLF